MKYRKIPKNKIQQGIDLCKRNILSFLEDAKLLIKEGKLNHAFVSVEFAIEELGKIVMLKETLKNSNLDPISAKDTIFTTHKGKSAKAWTVLDPKFKTIYEGGFEAEHFKFTSFDTDTEAAHQTRLHCAFVNFDESGAIWHVGREIDEVLLSELIKHLEQKLPHI